MSSPASDELFVQIPGDKKLCKKRSEEFHSVTQKLLFIIRRGRPDLETTTAYMCTRVSKSTENDWIKLIRLLKFLKNTQFNKRIMGIDDSEILRTWIDSSYAIHSDMRGQSGSLISLGHGSVNQRSIKQN